MRLHVAHAAAAGGNVAAVVRLLDSEPLLSPGFQLDPSFGEMLPGAGAFELHRAWGTSMATVSE